MLIHCLKNSVYSIVSKVKSESLSVASRALHNLKLTLWLVIFSDSTPYKSHTVASRYFTTTCFGLSL